MAVFQEKEVRNVRLFLSREISKISSMLMKANLGTIRQSDAEVREMLVKQKNQLIASRSKLLDNFQAKKLQVMSNQWTKIINDISDDKTMNGFIASGNSQILNIQELGRKTVRRKSKENSDNESASTSFRL